MKKFSILFLIIFALAAATHAQVESVSMSSVTEIEEFESLYQYQSYFISRQPNLQMLQWLKDEGVTAIINLRTEGENSDFSDYAFDEENNATDLGFEYFSIPVYGMDGYTPENLNILADILKTRDDVLIHCGSAGRATNFFMAYLIKYRGYTVDEAIEVGKGLRFTLPLESLLDAGIHMELVD